MSQSVNLTQQDKRVTQEEAYSVAVLIVAVKVRGVHALVLCLRRVRRRGIRRWCGLGGNSWPQTPNALQQSRDHGGVALNNAVYQPLLPLLAPLQLLPPGVIHFFHPFEDEIEIPASAAAPPHRRM